MLFVVAYRMNAVPDESIRALWQEFNLCATGWGVCPKFFNQLCQAMGKSMGIESDEKANEIFFAALDTDKVGGLRRLVSLWHAVHSERLKQPSPGCQTFRASLGGTLALAIFTK